MPQREPLRGFEDTYPTHFQCVVSQDLVKATFFCLFIMFILEIQCILGKNRNPSYPCLKPLGFNQREYGMQMKPASCICTSLFCSHFLCYLHWKEVCMHEASFFCTFEVTSFGYRQEIIFPFINQCLLTATMQPLFRDFI